MATQPSDPRPKGPAGPRASRAPDPDPSLVDYATRALLLWPGLDRRRLAAARGDPRRIARLVSYRTNLPPEAILRMLGVRSGGRSSPDPPGDA